MKLSYLWFWLLLILVSCTHAPIESEQPSGNFPPAISTIMTNSCNGTSCHTGRQDINDSLDLYTWEGMTRGSKFEYTVIPYNAAKSHLFEHINTNENLAAIAFPRMPLARDPLTAADQKTIFDWINHGAPSNDNKIAYSDVIHKVFIVCSGEDVITVLDDDVHKVIRASSIKTGSGMLSPSCIAITPDKSSIIVGTQASGGIVRKYNTNVLTSIAECRSGLSCNDIALTPDGTKGYITDYPSSGISRYGVFDAVSMTFLKTVISSSLRATYGMVTSHDGRYTYVSGSGSDNIGRISTKTDSIIKILPLGSDVPTPVPGEYQAKYFPGFMTISPNDSLLYVGCQNSSEVVVFDLHLDSIIARIPVLFNPYGSHLTPDGSELWVAAWGSDQIKVISTLTNTVTATIDSINTNPRSVAFSRDGKVAYVTTEKLDGGVHNHGVNGGAPASGIYIIDRITKKVIYTFAGAGYATEITTNF